MLELRTGPNGHPGYRRTCSEMHRLIAWIPQHKGIAESMKFVDHNRYELGRRRAEQRTEESRLRGAEPERRSGPEQEGSAEQQKENNDRVCPCCGFDKNDCRCCAGTAADRKRELKRIGAAPSPMRRRLRAEIDSGYKTGGGGARNRRSDDDPVGGAARRPPLRPGEPSERDVSP